MPADVAALSPARKDEVLRIARGHPDLGERAKALFVEPNIADRRRPEGAEQAVVGFYDYESDRSLVALVDPGRGEVVSVEQTTAQFQLSEEEREEAERIAGDDDRLREFLGGRAMNALTRLYFPPQAAQPGHRYAIVFVRPNNQERRYAVVDLSERAVVDVLQPDALTAK